MRRIQEYVTVTRAAEMLGVSASTLRNWDRAGKLKAARQCFNTGCSKWGVHAKSPERCE